MVDGITWEVDPQTGNHWPAVTDTDMSEVEVEEEVQQEAERMEEEVQREEAERTEEEVGQEDDPLAAARELLRAEVRARTGSFHVLSALIMYLGP